MFKFRKTSFRVALLFIFTFAAIAEDRHTGIGRMEPLFKVPESFPKGITEDQLKDLPLSDPKLRIAYFWLIRGARGSNEITDVRHPEVVAALRDVKKRGDSTTPLWLDIMVKNQDTALEFRIPILIGDIGTIKMGPYVDYFRKVLQTRGDSINGTLFGVALDTFFQYGNKEDVQVALDLAKKRPFLADYVQSALDTEQMRNPGPRTKPPISETSPSPAQTGDPRAPELASATNNAGSSHPEDTATTTPWLETAAGLIVAALGLFWFLLKRQK